MSVKSDPDYVTQLYMLELKRKNLTKWEKLKLIVYDPEKKEVFGKDGARWGRFVLFYVIFYTVLAAMSLSLWWLFSLTLNPRTPTHLTSESLIGTNPGLGFRPLPSSERNVLSSLIWYQGKNNNSFRFWVDGLTQFLDVYKKPGQTPGQGQNIFNCYYNQLPNPGQVCFVDVKLLSPCTEENSYMYHRSSPCIILKLNKIYGWKPQFYTDPNDLPHDMPQQLKQHIRDLATSGDGSKRLELNTVWVSCKGESPADSEFIGPVSYYPKQGFPGYYFPYENSEGYLSPLVAVHIERPKPGLLINIECRAWAKNINYRQKDKQGSVHFELMID
ncbi:hypothetical protein V9T40_001852 [Parthenolecanium corni]|uniref:Sodium/potassium-transporting ATPase subunit beta-2 n=1 Tax=Parthenolecanium corni TaxID=536013 RepID=A0AAN9Y3K1_9HEMI